jgi:hypothetical protein
VPPNKPLKLTAAGFSRASGRAQHAAWYHSARPQLSGHPLGGAVAVELYAFVNRSEIPSGEAWRQALAALGLPLELDPELDPLSDTGFSPCTLRGSATGFEIFLENAGDLDRPDAAAHFDSAIVFRWGSDLAECASALGAAAALRRAANAFVYYPADDMAYSDESLLSDFRDCIAALG